MQEKVLKNKKHGMLVLILSGLLYLAAAVSAIAGGIIADDGGSPVLVIVSIVYLCIGWLPFLGLKILKPQEALVLTLFGKYVGTIKGDGFFFVNPFFARLLNGNRPEPEGRPPPFFTVWKR